MLSEHFRTQVQKSSIKCSQDNKQLILHSLIASFVLCGGMSVCCSNEVTFSSCTPAAGLWTEGAAVSACWPSCPRWSCQEPLSNISWCRRPPSPTTCWVWPGRARAPAWTPGCCWSWLADLVSPCSWLLHCICWRDCWEPWDTLQTQPSHWTEILPLHLMMMNSDWQWLRWGGEDEWFSALVTSGTSGETETGKPENILNLSQENICDISHGQGCLSGRASQWQYDNTKHIQVTTHRTRF